MTEPYITLSDLVEILSTDLTEAEIEARVLEMLKMMRITELSNRNIDQLSGGQRQRIAVRPFSIRPPTAGRE